MADVIDKLKLTMEIDGKLHDFEQPIDPISYEVIRDLRDQNKILAQAVLDLDAEATDLTQRLNDVMKFVLTDTVELTIFASLAAGMAKYGTNLSTFNRELYGELAEVCRDIVDENVKVA